MIANQSVLDALHLSSRNGKLYADNERSLLVSIDAFGTLQKDLIENIGFERMKSFFFRYGVNIGSKDAEKALAKPFVSIEELAKHGPILHSLKGFAQAELLKLAIGKKKTGYHFYMEGLWHDSYEALEHHKNFALSNDQVCFTLTGYASGYISTILGETVIFKEVECSGMGAGACRWIGKTKKEWGDDVDEQLEYCQELPILKELELANQKLIEEKNNLAKVTQVHKLLTQEVIKGNNLESIAQVIYEQTGLSVLIENIHFQPLAYKGIEPEFLEELQEEFRQYLQDYQSLGKKFLLKTKVIDSVIGQRIVSPIFLQNEIVAYCSFFSKERVIQNQEIVTMFIERATSVCSLQLLNEKTRLESVERMKGRFLDEILNGKYTEKKEILKNASLIQLDLSQTYFMMAIEYKISSRNIKQELAIHERIFEEIVNYFKEGDLDALVEPKESKFIVLLANDGRSILENVRNLLKRLTKEFSGVLFQCGISLRNENIMEANEAYREALTALRMASSKMPAVTFDSLGVVGVLVNSNNKDAVVKMAKYTLGSLYDEKNEKKMELLRTLYVFLINGGNLEQTAEELALSVSGLRYRINKISSELNGDLRDAEENFQLLLSLKALKSIGVLEE